MSSAILGIILGSQIRDIGQIREQSWWASFPFQVTPFPYLRLSCMVMDTESLQICRYAKLIKNKYFLIVNTELRLCLNVESDQCILFRLTRSLIQSLTHKFYSNISNLVALDSSGNATQISFTRFAWGAGTQPSSRPIWTECTRSKSGSHSRTRPKTDPIRIVFNILWYAIYILWLYDMQNRFEKILYIRIWLIALIFVKYNILDWATKEER